MESIEVLNQRLIDYYGVDTLTGRAMFRIVWANDQTEKRLTDVTDSGVYLLHSTVREVKKYPYLTDLFVLERLSIVPDANRNELVDMKLSYEPVWTYCDKERNYLYPIWNATKYIVDTLYAALGKKSLAKYIDDEKNTTAEGRDERITALQEELFGDETATGDALAYGSGIVVPSNYKKEN